MKNFFQQLSWRMAQSMQGRNGVDELGSTFVVVSIILIIIEFFVGGGIASMLALACLAYAMFRQFSTNVVKRRQENQQFLQATEKPRRAIQLQYKKIKNRKTTVYFTCEECGTVFSLPKGKGKLRATCPHCKKQSIRNT